MNMTELKITTEHRNRVYKWYDYQQGLEIVETLAKIAKMINEAGMDDVLSDFELVVLQPDRILLRCMWHESKPCYMNIIDEHGLAVIGDIIDFKIVDDDEDKEIYAGVRKLQ